MPHGPVEYGTPEKIRTTAEHPFFVFGKGWTPLREIKLGDWIRTESGWTEVSAVEDTGKWETVYNVRVADYHTYFVGKDDSGSAVWAHNICFQHLDGADEAHARQGQVYVLLSQQAFASIPRLYQNATVAVSEAIVDGSRKYVFAVYGPQGAFEAVEAFAQTVSGVAYHAMGGIHAEDYIHRHFAYVAGFTGVIGHSNYNGTCSQCKTYFASVGFANVWWSKDKSL